VSRRGQSPLESSPPRPNFAAIPGPPLLPMVPPAADCSLSFAIAFATALACGEQPGHRLFNQNKMRQHLLKSLGDDTTLTEEESA